MTKWKLLEEFAIFSKQVYNSQLHRLLISIMSLFNNTLRTQHLAESKQRFDCQYAQIWVQKCIRNDAMTPPPLPSQGAAEVDR